MKKILIAVTVVVLAFCLVCCDAEKIAKAGKSLQKIGKVNAGYADKILVDLLEDVSGILDEYIDNHLGFEPLRGNMDTEVLAVMVGVVNMAKESSASAESITKILDQKATGVDQEKKRNLQVQEIVDEFLEDPKAVRNEMEDYLTSLLGGMSPEIEDQIRESLSDEKIDKIATTVKNIYPAIGALQSVNDQQVNHVDDNGQGYVTYGDVIANAIFSNTVYNVITLVANGSSATTEEKMNVVDNVINNLYALEVIYGVTFDVPQIAGNFVNSL